MFQQEIQNFQHDVALLQYYIDRRQRVGFYDMEKLIELFAVTIFKATHNYNLENLNYSLTNFPAIDLGEKNFQAAIQVTSNATSTKIKDTISKFISHGLNKKYPKLIVLGFCKASKTNVPDFCEVLDMDQMTQLLMNCGSSDTFQNVIDAIRKHHDYSKLHPFDDFDCLKIVLNCVDRNAVKHRISCEGNYLDMVSGLNEISELISKGQINKRSKSKSFDDFNDIEIQDYLRTVRDLISQILKVVNSKKRQGDNFICLDHNEMRSIDQLKDSIADASNNISRKKNINFQIQRYGV